MSTFRPREPSCFTVSLYFVLPLTAFFQHAPFIPIVGVGKERRTLIGHGDLQNGSTRYWNYLENYWPYAGGLSAVNAIGTQLRDAINSGLTRWRMTA